MNLEKEQLSQILKENPDLKIQNLNGMDALKEIATESSRVGMKAQTDGKYHIAPKEARFYDGRVYRSKKEARFAEGLDLRVKAGDIDFWLYEVPFRLPGKRVVYRLDFMTFSIIRQQTLEWSKELDEIGYGVNFYEVKGFKTPVGEIKRKQTEEIYKIHIEVV